MSQQNTRFTISKDVSVTTSAATTAEIIVSEFAAGQLQILSGSITGLTYWTCHKEGGTFLPAQDASGSAVTQTIAASKSYPIPAILFGAYAIKIVANAAGVLSICLKS